MSTKKGQLKFKDTEGTVTPFLPAGLFDGSNIDETTAKEIRKKLGVYKNIIFDECENYWDVYGTPQLENGELILDGSSYLRMQQKTLQINSTKPFTIEFIGKSDLSNPANTKMFFVVYCNDNWHFWVSQKAKTNNPSFYIKANGTVILDKAATEDVNIEHHHAISYDGTTFYAFLDGILQATVAASVTDNAYKISIGAHFTSTSCNATGTIKEFRISDICRYSEDFSSNVPSEPFTKDANTISLLHFD